jgi:PAS domain S-box-containing protein
VQRDGEVVGITIVGITLDRAIQSLRGSALSQLVIYGPEGELLRTTLNYDQATQNVLALSPEISRQARAIDSRAPIQDIKVGPTLYQAVYLPFIVDVDVLGVLALLQPNNLWYATDASRQLLSLALSGLVAAVVIVAFVGTGLMLRRLDRVTQTAQALAAGDPHARTGMKGTDEIGELGKAIDGYARRAQKRQDSLEALLREQRRESVRLIAILESIPDGIIVQDLDGRVILMNDAALRLLGSQRVFRSSPLNELTAVVTDTLGAALAPGIYSLGDAQRIPLDGRILHAQAAAILTEGEKRLGTVIVLRDVSDEVRREQARVALLSEMSRETVREPSVGKGTEATLEEFIHEVNRNAMALQRMIAEIRDLSTLDSRSIQQTQQALSAEMLFWNTVREWQPAATAVHIGLHVLILRRGLLVLGEERRLRWAVGNLIDNAIKYTQKGGHVTLMLRASDDDQQAQFSIKDTGVGISSADLPHVFTRFFRGKPMARNGQLLVTPGTGQGLFIARRVIEAHGGTIDLTSTPGQGTEVVFKLPLTADVTIDLSQKREIHASDPLPVDTRGSQSKADHADEDMSGSR